MRPCWSSLAACSVLAAAPAAGQGLAGTWRGHWARGGDTLPVIMHISDSAGTLRGSFDSDRLRVLGIPLSDVEQGEEGAVTFRVVGDATTTEFTGVLRADSLAGTFREANTTGDFAFVRAASPEPAVRQVELKVPNGAVTLAGTLLLPAGQAPAPVVVFLHGSRGEGRWASRFLATRLAQRGVGAFIWDKRGVGASTGNWQQAGIEDLAGDAAAVIRALAADRRVDARRIGLHGHSQGGTMVPMVAARARVAFVVGSAAAAGPTDSTEIFSILNFVLPSAPTAADSADARVFVAEVVGVAYRGRPRARLDSLVSVWRERTWMFELPPPGDYYWTFARSVADYDGLRWWPQVRVPVLLVYGADDQRVPAPASADRIAAALRQAGNRDVTVRLFPGADHTFRTPPGPGGWASTAPGYLDFLIGWIAEQAAR